MDASHRLSPTEKAVALVSVAVVVFVLAIGLPVLDPSIPPSKNLAILPGSNGGLIRSCTASSAASWISCIAKVNAGQAQRVYVNGVIECSDTSSCRAEIQSGPVVIQAITPQKSGFKRSSGWESPLLVIDSTKDVTVRDLLFDETETQCPTCNSPVIQASHSSRVTLRGVVMRGAKRDGIAFNNVSQAVVLATDVTQSGGNGVVINNDPTLESPQFDLIGNTFSSNKGAGAVLKGSGTEQTPARVAGNEFQINSAGIVLKDPARYIAILKNLIDANSGGEYGGDGVVSVSQSVSSDLSGIQFIGNTIKDNSGFGLNVSGGLLSDSQGIVSTNTIQSNKKGALSTLAVASNGSDQGKAVTSGDSAVPPRTPSSAPSASPTGSSGATTGTKSGEVAPALVINRVINAASLDERLGAFSLAIAEGVTGASGTCDAKSDSYTPLPTKLCGVELVYINEGEETTQQALPLLSVSPNKVTFQLPGLPKVPRQPLTPPGIEYSSLREYLQLVAWSENSQIGTSTKKSISRRPLVPAIFTDSSGPEAFNKTGRVTLNSPAPRGSRVGLRGTGFGSHPYIRLGIGAPYPQSINDKMYVKVGTEKLSSYGYKTPDKVGEDTVVLTVPPTSLAGELKFSVCILDNDLYQYYVVKPTHLNLDAYELASSCTQELTLPIADTVEQEETFQMKASNSYISMDSGVIQDTWVPGGRMRIDFTDPNPDYVTDPNPGPFGNKITKTMQVLFRTKDAWVSAPRVRSGGSDMTGFQKFLDVQIPFGASIEGRYELWEFTEFGDGWKEFSRKGGAESRLSNADLRLGKFSQTVDGRSTGLENNSQLSENSLISLTGPNFGLVTSDRFYPFSVWNPNDIFVSLRLPPAKKTWERAKGLRIFSNPETGLFARLGQTELLAGIDRILFKLPPSLFSLLKYEWQNDGDLGLLEVCATELIPPGTSCNDEAAEGPGRKQIRISLPQPRAKVTIGDQSQPVSGAVVEMRDSENMLLSNNANQPMRGTTGADGTVSFNARPSDWMFRVKAVTKDGRLYYDPPREKLLAESWTTEIKLVPAVKLCIMVRDQSGRLGSGLSRVIATLTRSDAAGEEIPGMPSVVEATTDPSGVACFEVPQQRAYQAQFRRAGYTINGNNGRAISTGTQLSQTVVVSARRAATATKKTEQKAPEKKKKPAPKKPASKQPPKKR